LDCFRIAILVGIIVSGNPAFGCCTVVKKPVGSGFFFFFVKVWRDTTRLVDTTPANPTFSSVKASIYRVTG
jgi:hypothetical protein